MKNITVIGGSSGIGLALIQKLANDCRIVNISLSACPVAGVQNIIVDVTDSEALKTAFSRIDCMDALIYCAAVSLAAPVEYLDAADCRRLINTNLTGAMECCSLALPLLSSSKDGRILLLSSSGGTAPIAFDAPYSASKAALDMFARALSLETKVKITSAAIGGTRTRFSFKRKIYTDCGSYDQNLKSAADALIKIEQTGYSSSFVADKLIKILRSANPPSTVAIGFKNKLALGFYRLMPKRLKHAVDKAVYKLQQ